MHPSARSALLENHVPTSLFIACSCSLLLVRWPKHRRSDGSHLAGSQFRACYARRHQSCGLVLGRYGHGHRMSWGWCMATILG